MSFIEQKLEAYCDGADPEYAEVAEEIAGEMKTTAHDDREAIKAVHDEVAVEVEDGFDQGDLNDAIDDAVIATLKWVGVY